MNSISTTSTYTSTTTDTRSSRQWLNRRPSFRPLQSPFYPVQPRSFAKKQRLRSRDFFKPQYLHERPMLLEQHFITDSCRSVKDHQ